jgi:hypothetical protein
MLGSSSRVSRRQFVLGAGAAAAASTGLAPGSAQASSPGEGGTWLTGTVVANDGTTLRVQQFGGEPCTVAIGPGAQPTLEGPVDFSAFGPGLEIVATGAWDDDGTFVAGTLEGLYRVRDVTVTGEAGEVLKTTGGDVEVSAQTAPRGGQALGKHVDERAPAAIAAGDRIIAMGRIDPADGALAAKMIGTVKAK